MRSLFLVGLSLTLMSAAVTDAEGRSRRRRSIPTFRSNGSPNIQSRAAFVIERQSGKVLFERRANQRRSIASISKLAAVLVVVEHGLKLEEPMTITAADRAVAKGGARSRMLEGYRFSNDDLLHAALLGSDNRAVSALGRSVGLDSQALTEAMTAKAEELGLIYTRFEDPVGLAYGNVSTAREIIVLLREALAHPLIASILRKPTHTAHSISDRPKKIHYRNTNKLLFKSGVETLGGKTGYNAEAVYCLVGAVQLSDGTVIDAAFLGSYGELTRFGDYGRMLSWIARERRKSRTEAPVQTARLALDGPPGSR